jgi:hypothetical protein
LDSSFPVIMVLSWFVKCCDFDLSQGNWGISYIDACLKYMLNINKGVICKVFKSNNLNPFVSRCLVLCMILDNFACGTTANLVS